MLPVEELAIRHLYYKLSLLSDFVYFTTIIAVFYYVANNLIVVKKKGHPPSSKLYPVVGNSYVILSLYNEKDIVKLLQRYMRKFGSPATFYLGPWIRIVGINKPEHLETVMKSQKANEKPGFFYNKIGFLKDGIVTLPAKIWKVHRKLIQPCFNFKILDSFVTTFALNSSKLCAQLEEHVDGPSFHCEPLLSFKALSTVIETVLDTSPELVGSDLIKRTIQETDEESTAIANRFVHAIVDLIFPLTKEGRESAKRIKHWNEFVERIIDTHQKQAATQDNPQKEISSKFIEKASTLSKTEFKMGIMTVCMAGFATSATAESYTLVLLGIHKAIQEKVHEEIDSIFEGSDRPLTNDDLPRLKYLEQVIKESMRLFPPVPHLIREVTDDMELDGYIVSKGTNILIMVDQLHRHPGTWKNPDEFNPENFSPENIAKRNPYAFVPWSAGPRNCIGYRYALMAMKATLASVLRRYTINTDMKMSDLQITRPITINVSELHIKIKRRSQEVFQDSVCQN